MLPPESYLRSERLSFEQSAETWLHCANGELIVDGHAETLFQIMLNSAMEVGNDVLRLAARIHGQCELHCYVEGKHRAWLASIVQQGLDSNVYRSNVGWEKVVKLLELDTKNPVVTSYSVCDQFPNSFVAGWEDDSDGDGWYGLPHKKQWHMAMAGLRKQAGGLELTPENWDSIRFGKGITAFSLYNRQWQAKRTQDEQTKQA
jgi:hypothetical protein